MGGRWFAAAVGFRRALISLFLGLLVTSTLVEGARAQSEMARTGPAVVPPRLLEHAEVAYPDGAQGDAVVVVTLTVNADGRVRSVELQSGEPPFAALAEQAVS